MRPSLQGEGARAHRPDRRRGKLLEEATDLRSADPLKFFDLRAYNERLAEAEIATGLGDTLVIGSATIEDLRCELAVMDFSFMGGSMGSVTGEKFVLACESAASAGVPLISISASGGARMQEGILALMQLPKTVVAVEELHEAGCALISVMAHPTTGGLLASFASLGDVLLAEPGALMSFAGPRSSRRRPARSCRTTSVSPSRTFASATSTRSFRAPSCDRRSHGCFGSSERSRVARDAEIRLRDRLSKLGGLDLLRGARLSGELERLKRQLDRIEAEPTDEEIWTKVELARHEDRPYTLDYVGRILDDWFELHGDRGEQTTTRSWLESASWKAARSR